MIRLHEAFDDTDGAYVKRIFNKHSQDIRLLVNQTASSAWSPGFNNMLRRCIYVRSQPSEDKEVYRTRGFRCVACGKWEYCNARVVDAFGFMRVDEDRDEDLLTMPAEDAAVECEDLAFFLDGLEDTDVQVGQLARFDLGRLTMGETCHTRFKLVMDIRNLMFDKYLRIRDEIDERTIYGTIEPIESKLYGDSVEDANEYLERRAALEYALTTMKPPFPPSNPTRAIFDIVDIARSEASGGDDDTLNALLRQRTHIELGGFTCDNYGLMEDNYGLVEAVRKGEMVRAEVVGYDDDKDYGASLPPRRRRRDSPPPHRNRRPQVIDDDDDDDEDYTGSPPPRRRRRDSPPPHRSRRPQVVDDDDDNDGDDEEDSDEPKGDAPEEAGGSGDVLGAAVQTRARRSPQAIGRLPSRHKAIVNALQLAAAFQAQGYTSKSVTVTNLVATCQELLDGRLPLQHKAVVDALRLAATLQAQGCTSESATVTNLVVTCQELLNGKWT
jgi:hypothetical protein